MKIKSEKDFWSGLMFLAVGVGFAWGATNYSFGSAARPGPAYFPFGLGIIMAALGAIILFKALVIEVEGSDRLGGVAWKPLAIIVGSVVLFGLLLPRLGMFIALPLLVITTALAGDEFHWGEAIANATVLSAGSWVIFIWGLNLTIPLWPTFIR
ncbi:MAG: tripartite tricarboxylate transporter TctB family protein [Burkholderiaceae bacterium]|nr:tripartite tricarboxylate transporter TctB family protein [Burkholderiaceae bacterium]